MEREIRRAVRAEQPLGVLMLDLDHFKKFNDTQGHDAGSRSARRCLFLDKKRAQRRHRVPLRWRGVRHFLPMADRNVSLTGAERIGTKLQKLTVLHQGRSVGGITVSVGVAALPDNGTSPRDLLEAADAALYRAKRDGRNRIVVADLSVPAETAASPAQS